MLWAAPVFADANDCQGAGRVLLKEGKFKISRKGDGAYLFVSSSPPPHPDDESFVAWNWVYEALPTIHPEHLIERERLNRREFSRDYREYLKSEGLSFPHKKQIPIAQVNQYRVQFSRGKTFSELYLRIPVRPNGLANTELLARIRRALRELPTYALQKIDSIALSPWPSLIRPERGEGLAEIMEKVLPGAKKQLFIMLYPQALYRGPSDLVHTLRHELGHVMAFDFFGNYVPDSRWIEATRADGKKIFDIVEISPAEDFAEAFALYLDQKKNHRARLKYPHRFQILDKIIEQYQ